MPKKTVIILGAGWAGLPLAHKLLKYTASAVDLKVVLVAPNSHFYWNVAATRGIIPGAIPEDSLFLPIQTAFEKYPADNFEFVLGAASSLDPGSNAVEIQMNNGTIQNRIYDQLVVATGSRLSSGLPLKPLGAHETTVKALRDLQTTIHNAKSIVIAGAGPTGVEVAGELAAKYGSAKDITIIMVGDKPLDSDENVLVSVRDVAEKSLRSLGVRIIKQARVSSTKAKGDNEKQVTLSLSNGRQITTDCFLPMYGMSLNNSFVPKEFLGPDGSLKQDETMRVAGSKNIWALGDIGSLEPKQLTVTDNQIIHLASNLDSVLKGSEAVKAYSPVGKAMIFISMGKKVATGHVGNWKLWGFMVSYVKGRNLFVDTAAGYVGGKHLRHASM